VVYFYIKKRKLKIARLKSSCLLYNVVVSLPFETDVSDSFEFIGIHVYQKDIIVKITIVD
jgi:hypothetical protein